MIKNRSEVMKLSKEEKPIFKMDFTKEVVLVILKEEIKMIDKYKIFSTEEEAFEFTKNDSYLKIVLDKPMKIGIMYHGQDFQMIKMEMKIWRNVLFVENKIVFVEKK